LTQILRGRCVRAEIEVTIAFAADGQALRADLARHEHLRGKAPRV